MDAFNKKILVDLTPILPGGSNGGAKVFILELIKCMVELKPDILWTLVIQEGVESELKKLIKPNLRLKTIQYKPRKETHFLLKGVVRLLMKCLGRVFFLVSPKIKQYIKQKVLFLIYSQKSPQISKINTREYDLLFCPFTRPHFFDKKVPCVSIIYDLQYETYPQFFTSNDVTHRKMVFTEACHKSQRLVAISDYSRDVAIMHGKLSPQKIETIHIALANRFEKMTFNLKIIDQLKLIKEKYFIYSANFWQHKNHEMLIVAFQIAISKGLDSSIQLVLTGAPCERQAYLKTVIKKLNLEHRIKLLDYVSNVDLASLLKHSLALVFPSLYEGFGMPVVEAMNFGVPVACSDCSSLPEVAGDAAVYFNPKKPIEIATRLIELSQNEDLRKSCISKGQQQGRKFSNSEQMARDYLNLFERVIDDGPVIQDSVKGIYSDGWAGDKVNIHVKEHMHHQKLRLDLFVPEWLPGEHYLSIKKKSAYLKKESSFTFKLTNGKVSKITIPVDKKGAYFDLSMPTGFIPAKVSPDSKDNRRLTAIIKNCSIVREDEIHVHFSL